MMKIKKLVLITLILCLICSAQLFSTNVVFAQTGCQYDYNELEIVDNKLFKKGVFKKSLVTGRVCMYTNRGKTVLDVVNGKIQAEIPYIDGSINGIMKTYYEWGQLKSETPFKNGIINGIEKYYYQNGKLSQLVPYVNGSKQGNMQKYNQNGEISIEITYGNDSPISGICYKDRDPRTQDEQVNKYVYGRRIYDKINLTSAQLQNWEKGLPINCN